MRDTTERPESVDAGTLKQVGTDEETGRGFRRQQVREAFRRMQETHNRNPADSKNLFLEYQASISDGTTNNRNESSNSIGY